MKSKLETSAMVRISNKHIRKAKKIKRLTGVPVGKIFEDALDCYDKIKTESTLKKEDELDNINND